MSLLHQRVALSPLAVLIHLVLVVLIVRLFYAQKSATISTSLCNVDISCASNTRSSANIKIGRHIPKKCTLCLSSRPLSASFLSTYSASLSMNSENTKGDAGHPYFTPDSIPNPFDSFPSTTTYAVTPTYICYNASTISLGMPNSSASTQNKCFLSMRSYAFCKST